PTVRRRVVAIGRRRLGVRHRVVAIGRSRLGVRIVIIVVVLRWAWFRIDHEAKRSKQRDKETHSNLLHRWHPFTYEVPMVWRPRFQNMPSGSTGRCEVVHTSRKTSSRCGAKAPSAEAAFFAPRLAAEAPNRTHGACLGVLEPTPSASAPDRRRPARTAYQAGGINAPEPARSSADTETNPRGSAGRGHIPWKRPGREHKCR